jgi:glycosyltransferase involved in cell wall biosynthesis
VRILIIHNRYQQRGGEDTTFEQEVALLSQTEEVQTLTFQNFSGWKGAAQFILSIWNIFSAAKVRKSIRQFQPDVVHVHNWHYAVGPVVVRSVHNREVPVVLTVQNFRLLCPSATLLYKNSLFLDSLHAGFPWKAIRKKVYRNSFLQTFWLAFIIWVHKKIGTWKMVDRYIVQTGLAKSLFISSSLGTSESQFSIKPNFVVDPGVGLNRREDFFLYIGRLSEEKGIKTILEAFKNKIYGLYIGGDGPLKEDVLNASKADPHIRYLGLLDKNSVQEMMRRCSALIFPSIWYEGMPLTLIEAFALGTPVIASNLGAMASMITDGYNGLHFEAGNARGLSEKIDFWESLSKDGRKLFSDHARTCYEQIYTSEKNREQIMAIYQSVIKNKSGL